MKNLFILPVALVVGGALIAPAARASYCTNFAQVSNSITSCEDNDKFMTAGEACLDKLDADVAKATASLQKNFTPDADAKQKAKFQSSQLDYGLSSNALADLIASAKQAQSDISAYESVLEMPEDADEEDVTGGNADNYAMGVDCYGQVKKSLDSINEDFLYEERKLEAAKAMADASGATSGKSAGALNGDNSQNLGAPVPGANTGSGPIVNKPYDGSDISGTQPKSKTGN